MKRCTACSDNTRYIGPYGSKGARVAAVGEGPVDAHPDESDAVFGFDVTPRVRSGEMLERVFGELDASLDDVYWTNVYKCVGQRPDGCLDHLERELQLFGTVIALGNAAADAMDRKYISYDKQIWHPAYVMRNQSRFPEYVAKWDSVLSPPSGQAGLDAFR